MIYMKRKGAKTSAPGELWGTQSLDSLRVVLVCFASQENQMSCNEINLLYLNSISHLGCLGCLKVCCRYLDGCGLKLRCVRQVKRIVSFGLLAQFHQFWILCLGSIHPTPRIFLYLFYEACTYPVLPSRCLHVAA